MTKPKLFTEVANEEQARIKKALRNGQVYYPSDVLGTKHFVPFLADILANHVGKENIDFQTLGTNHAMIKRFAELLGNLDSGMEQVAQGISNIGIEFSCRWMALSKRKDEISSRTRSLEEVTEIINRELSLEEHGVKLRPDKDWGLAIASAQCIVFGAYSISGNLAEIHRHPIFSSDMIFELLCLMNEAIFVVDVKSDQLETQTEPMITDVLKSKSGAFVTTDSFATSTFLAEQLLTSGTVQLRDTIQYLRLCNPHNVPYSLEESNFPVLFTWVDLFNLLLTSEQTQGQVFFFSPDYVDEDGYAVDKWGSVTKRSADVIEAKFMKPVYGLSELSTRLLILAGAHVSKRELAAKLSGLDESKNEQKASDWQRSKMTELRAEIEKEDLPQEILDSINNAFDKMEEVFKVLEEGSVTGNGSKEEPDLPRHFARDRRFRKLRKDVETIGISICESKGYQLKDLVRNEVTCRVGKKMEKLRLDKSTGNITTKGKFFKKLKIRSINGEIGLFGFKIGAEAVVSSERLSNPETKAAQNVLDLLNEDSGIAAVRMALFSCTKLKILGGGNSGSYLPRGGQIEVHHFEAINAKVLKNLDCYYQEHENRIFIDLGEGPREITMLNQEENVYHLGDIIKLPQDVKTANIHSISGWIG